MPTLPTFDPLAVPVNRQEINAVRDFLEGSPVLLGDFWFDFDDRAEKRMTDALELWDEFDQEDIEWTLADNSRQWLTLSELQDTYEDGKRLRAIRAFRLHQEATVYKTQESTQRDMVKWIFQHLMPGRVYSHLFEAAGSPVNQ